MHFLSSGRLSLLSLSRMPKKTRPQQFSSKCINICDCFIVNKSKVNTNEYIEIVRKHKQYAQIEICAESDIWRNLIRMVMSVYKNKHIHLMTFICTKSCKSVESQWHIHQQNIHPNFFDIQILIAVSTMPSSHGTCMFRPGTQERSSDGCVFFVNCHVNVVVQLQYELNHCADANS